MKVQVVFSIVITPAEMLKMQVTRSIGFHFVLVCIQDSVRRLIVSPSRDNMDKKAGEISRLAAIFSQICIFPNVKLLCQPGFKADNENKTDSLS